MKAKLVKESLFDNKIKFDYQTSQYNEENLSELLNIDLKFEAEDSNVKYFKLKADDIEYDTWSLALYNNDTEFQFWHNDTPIPIIKLNSISEVDDMLQHSIEHPLSIKFLTKQSWEAVKNEVNL